MHIVNVISNKYVPAPLRRLAQYELLLGICQFKYSVLWRKFWFKYEEGSEIDYEEVMEKIFDKEGLIRNLGPKSNSAIKGSDRLECFQSN